MKEFNGAVNNFNMFVMYYRKSSRRLATHWHVLCGMKSIPESFPPIGFNPSKTTGQSHPTQTRDRRAAAAALYTQAKFCSRFKCSDINTACFYGLRESRRCQTDWYSSLTTDSFEHKITENVLVFVFAHAILKNRRCALS